MSSLASDWVRSAGRALTLHAVPLGARLRLVSLGIRIRLGPARDRSWRFGAGIVEWPRETLKIDWRVFAEVFLHRIYASDYRSAVVIDAGAHKGYFGAYALLGGADAVLSLEPASQNFRFLDRAAASAVACGRTWRTRQVAVGARDGEAELRIDEQSWAHTVLPSAAHVPDDASRQRVPVIAMQRVLETARALGSGRMIVKLDVEGAECEIVRGTPFAAWESVDVMFIEHHDFAPCSAEDLGKHLARAGLRLRESRAGGVLMFRR